MDLKYEVHNFDSNQEPRQYEAVYQAGEALIVKAIIYQRVVRGAGSKPRMQWKAFALAWTPGQGEDDWTQLAHLQTNEITLRDIIAHEANEDMWVEAAQYDAQKLIDRARPFAGVLSTAMAAQGGRKGRLKAA